MNEKKFFITTPIYYVNDKPHIGHAYATIAADILARYHRLLGQEVFFLTGVDENSQKTVVAAQKVGKSVLNYTNELADTWQTTWQKLSLTNDDFIRTTEKRHINFVKDFYLKVEQNSDIYKDHYEGLYCLGHEAFLRDSDLDENGLCPDHKTKPELLKEDNYFFRLSAYQEKLLTFYRQNPQFIQPEERFNEVTSFVKSGLQDISISRQTQKWGIEVPHDPSQVIYVWFDALLNYISASPKHWPADTHLIGKDILRFHAIIWPAMLLSAGYPLPKKIFAHGFFTVDGVKISKSLGNTVDPIELSKQFGNDGLRYLLFREFPFGNDGDFSLEHFKEVYNSDLANGLGNLVARVCRLAQSLELPGLSQPKKSLLDSTYRVHLERLEFLEALEYVWGKIRQADRKIESTKPWELIDSDRPKAISLVENLLLQLLEIKELVAPFLPETALKMEAQLFSPQITAGPGLFPRK